MLSPCWGHVWPTFTSQPAIALKFSRLSQHGQRPMSLRGCPILGTMSGPCWGHAWPSFLPDQLEHWNFQDWINMVKGLCLWSFYVWRPCKDHVETMLGLVFLPDQLEHWNFQDWVSMVQGPCLESVYLRGPCQDHVRTMFGLTLLLDQLEQWNFHPWDNMVKSLCLWSVYFADPVRTMLGPCFA